MEHHHEHTAEKNIKVAFWLNTLFSLIEIAGGIFTNSLAILSNAFHDLGDAVALGLALYFQRVSAKKRDDIYTYGYKRYSLAGAVVSGIILFSGSLIIIIEAIPRLFNPEHINARGMLLLAVIGILINGFAALRLSGGHSHNQKIISLHLLEDVLGWTAVLVASIVVHFFNIPIIDPLLSLGITIFILIRLFRNMKQVFGIFMQAIPGVVNTGELEHEILKIEGVAGVHDLHFWTLDGEYNVASLHIAVHEKTDLKATESLRCEIRKLLKDKGYNHATIEIELAGKQCEFEDC